MSELQVPRSEILQYRSPKSAASHLGNETRAHSTKQGMVFVLAWILPNVVSCGFGAGGLETIFLGRWFQIGLKAITPDAYCEPPRTCAQTCCWECVKRLIQHLCWAGTAVSSHSANQSSWCCPGDTSRLPVQSRRFLQNGFPEEVCLTSVSTARRSNWEVWPDFQDEAKALPVWV